MQFIDKAINQVVKWESIDTTIPEMLNLIQSEILEKASGNDMRELEKGMHKTWVLGVGGGASRRYYPASNRPVRLCLQFNIFTHRLQRISLQDTVNKKEYFIPSGKAACTKLQRAVLRRMAQYSNDGTSVQRKSKSGGKFLNNKKKWPTFSAFTIFGFVAVVAVGIGAIMILSHIGNTNSDAIVTVQNGYLGEYTDLTVKEILDSCYGMMYEEDIWDGGETDSGSMIVEVKFYDEGMEEDSTSIQFTMLNDECFKISAFIDPLHPVERETDFFAAMNYNYLVAYMGRNRINPGDLTSEIELLGKLDEISGSAVKYGASAAYGGNRASICEIEGQKPLDVSVTMLLDNYGLVDLTDYISNGTEDNLAEDLTTETEPPETVVTELTEPSTESNRVPWTETDEFWDFWEKYTVCYDPMAGQYIGPVVDGRNLNFSIAALEDADGNRVFLLSYPLAGKIIESDGEYFEVADVVEFPTENHSFTNRSAMAVFTIDEYYPEYSGDFVINLQYTSAGMEYSIYANIPGVLDTKGETWIVENVSESEYE